MLEERGSAKESKEEVWCGVCVGVGLGWGRKVVGGTPQVINKHTYPSSVSWRQTKTCSLYLACNLRKEATIT